MREQDSSGRTSWPQSRPSHIGILAAIAIPKFSATRDHDHDEKLDEGKSLVVLASRRSIMRTRMPTPTARLDSAS